MWQKGLEIDKSKIEVIEKLPQLIFVNAIYSFLGLSSFYLRFIKEFSNIAHLLCKLLEKEVKFHFDDASVVSFKFLKEKWIAYLVITCSDWSEHFEVICDASGTTLGVILGKKLTNYFTLFTTQEKLFTLLSVTI